MARIRNVSHKHTEAGTTVYMLRWGLNSHVLVELTEYGVSANVHRWIGLERFIRSGMNSARLDIIKETYTIIS